MFLINAELDTSKLNVFCIGINVFFQPRNYLYVFLSVVYINFGFWFVDIRIHVLEELLALTKSSVV